MSVNVSHYTANPEGQEPDESMSVNASHYPANPEVRTRRINECKRISLPSQSLGSEPEESISVNASHYLANP